VNDSDDGLLLGTCHGFIFRVGGMKHLLFECVQAVRGVRIRSE